MYSCIVFSKSLFRCVVLRSLDFKFLSYFEKIAHMSVV